MSDEDMDNMENRMESMMDEMGDANPLSLMMNMGQPMDGEENEGDDDLVPGSSATFRWRQGGACRKQQKAPGIASGA